MNVSSLQILCRRHFCPIFSHFSVDRKRIIGVVSFAIWQCFCIIWRECQQPETKREGSHQKIQTAKSKEGEAILSTTNERGKLDVTLPVLPPVLALLSLCLISVNLTSLQQTLLNIPKQQTNKRTRETKTKKKPTHEDCVAPFCYRACHPTMCCP